MKDYPVISFGENPVLSSEDATYETSNTVYLGTTNPRSYGGIVGLIQLVVKQLLNSTGTNSFLPGMGGNFTNYIGMALEQTQFDAVLGDLVMRTKDLEEIIRSTQAGINGLAADERLASLDIIDYSINDAEKIIFFKFRITTAAGTTAETRLVL